MIKLLELKFQSKLNDAACGGGTDDSIVRGQNRAAGIAKINMVKDIEELTANLNGGPLAQADEPEYREGVVGGSRAAKDVLAAVAERALSRLNERGRVKPLHAALGEIAPGIAYLLSSFVAGKRAVANVTRCVDGEWESAAKGHNGAGLPVAQHLAQRTRGQNRLARSNRQFPGDRNHGVASDVVQAPSPVEPQVVEIGSGLINVGDSSDVL